MKFKILLLALSCCLSTVLSAHTLDYGPVVLRHWTVPGAGKTLDGAFLMYKNHEVYLEERNHRVSHFPLAAFSPADQAFALKKHAWVTQLNAEFSAAHARPTAVPAPVSFTTRFFLLAGLLGLIGWYVLAVADQERRRYVRPIGLALGAMLLFGFTKKVLQAQQTTSDPLVLDAAFTPFKPQVSTYWNTTYFYVQSRGIPTTHPMMAGITNWQQQVPIPQCYVGPNAWPIPLNPVVAATPVPVNPSHFSRGAVAVAVNGVAIFNPYTNTGVDAFLDGQLDNFGGHCGMADDYHYHTAPLSLYSQTLATRPIAYGLDGFAVYGPTEPDGVAMTALDANHGHYYGTAGVYHYHGTAAAPYMIGSMVGQVTEDATHQIIPQAAARPVRPGQQPLRGAVITGCVANAAGNGYAVAYTLNNQSYSLNYNWTTGGLYTFNLVAPTGTTTNAYNGTAPCAVPTATRVSNAGSTAGAVYPNPSRQGFALALGPDIAESDVQDIAIYDQKGALLYRTRHYQAAINPGPLAPGSYVVKVQTATTAWTSKLLVE